MSAYSVLSLFCVGVSTDAVRYNNSVLYFGALYGSTG